MGVVSCCKTRILLTVVRAELTNMLIPILLTRRVDLVNVRPLTNRSTAKLTLYKSVMLQSRV